MKKLLFILLLLLPFVGSAQTPDGFWGLKFYMNELDVQEIVKMRSGKIPEEGSGGTLLAYKNCNFGKYKAYLVQLVFQNGKLYGGDVFINPGQADLLTAYSDIVDEITSKYDQPMIEKGANGFTSTWSPMGNSKKAANYKISASVNNSVIHITYRDGQIYGQLLSSIEKYNTSDY